MARVQTTLENLMFQSFKKIKLDQFRQQLSPEQLPYFGTNHLFLWTIVLVILRWEGLLQKLKIQLFYMFLEEIHKWLLIARWIFIEMNCLLMFYVLAMLSNFWRNPRYSNRFMPGQIRSSHSNLKRSKSRIQYWTNGKEGK